MTEETKVDETANFDVATTDAVEPEKVQEPQEESAPPEDNKGDESTKEADNASEENAAKKSGGRLQKRIDRLTKRAADAERRAEEAEKKLNSDSSDKAEDKASTDEEPDPSDFDDYDEYLEALSEFNSDDKKQSEDNDAESKKDSPSDNASTDDAEFNAALEDVNDAFEDSREKYDDFDDVVVNAKDLQISRDMVVAMSYAEEPGEIAYHLGNNKKEASRIAKLSPIAQAREIGKLEVKLASKPKTVTKKTTEAPEPIDPVGGSDSTSKSMSDMDFSEYERTRNKQELGGKGFW